jgi:hypothetical protein
LLRVSSQRALGVLSVIVLASGCGGSDPVVTKGQTSEGSAVAITTTVVTQSTSQSRAGGLASVPITSSRGYKYTFNVDSIKVATQLGDPGIVKFKYDARLSISNSTPDRPSPEIGEVIVTYYYDIAVARSLESASKMQVIGGALTAGGGNCSTFSRSVSGGTYCDVAIAFNYPRPQVIQSNQSATIASLSGPTWSAQEASSTQVAAFLERPAFIKIQFREGTSPVTGEPAPLHY